MDIEQKAKLHLEFIEEFTDNYQIKQNVNGDAVFNWFMHKLSIPIEPPVKPANGEQETFRVIEELLDICTRGDAIKNNCRRCMDYYKYKDSRLSV